MWSYQKVLVLLFPIDFTELAQARLLDLAYRFAQPRSTRLFTIFLGVHWTFKSSPSVLFWHRRLLSRFQSWICILLWGHHWLGSAAADGVFLSPTDAHISVLQVSFQFVWFSDLSFRSHFDRWHGLDSCFLCFSVCSRISPKVYIVLLDTPVAWSMSSSLVVVSEVLQCTAVRFVF